MKLIEILRQNTQDLKQEYFTQTKSWASIHFNDTLKFIEYRELDWCKYFNLTPEPHNATSPSMMFMGLPRGFYNTKNSRVMDSIRREAFSFNKMGEEKYIQKQLDKANLHYEGSLRKLEDRLIKKGVIETNPLDLVKGRVGINLELIIKQNNITVKAWTIVASGQVQRPHYRYLVK